MKTSIAVLALIGAIDVNQAIKLQFVPQNIVQSGSVDEKDIKWEQNVQLSDVFDEDFDHDHSKFSQRQVNQFDGLIHAQGRVYDPATHEQIIDQNDIQLDESRFEGEPIALLQQKLDLQWHGHDVEMNDEDWYDRTFERALTKDAERREFNAQVNMFDGMIHTQDGRVFDPANGREIDQDFEDLQTQSNDWFDDSMDRKNTDAAPVVNQFDGLIHTSNGRMFSAINGKEVIQDDYDYVQLGDIYDEDLESRMVKKQKEGVFAADGLFHSPSGGAYDPRNGRNLASEMKADDEFVQMELKDWDTELDENPNALIRMKGVPAKINARTGEVQDFKDFAQNKNSASGEWEDLHGIVGQQKPNQFDGLIHAENGHVIDPISHQDVTSQQEDQDFS